MLCSFAASFLLQLTRFRCAPLSPSQVSLCDLHTIARLDNISLGNALHQVHIGNYTIHTRQTRRKRRKEKNIVYLKLVIAYMVLFIRHCCGGCCCCYCCCSCSIIFTSKFAFLLARLCVHISTFRRRTMKHRCENPDKQRPNWNDIITLLLFTYRIY